MFTSVIFEFSFANGKTQAEQDQIRPVPNSSLYKIAHSGTWFNHQKGLLNQDECHQALAKKLGLTLSELLYAIKAMPQPSLPIGAITLQDKFPDMRFFAVGNASGDQLDALQAHPRRDKKPTLPIITSCQLGERLPHAGFIRKLVIAGQLKPSDTLYVTQNLEHAAAAQLGGFQTMVYKSEVQCATGVRKLCSNPIQSGLSFLKHHAKCLDLQTSEGEGLKDACCQLHIMEALGDESLVYLPGSSPPFTWLYDDSVRKVPVYSKPPCVDHNSIALSVLKDVTMDQRHDIMDQMLQLRDSEGIMQVYFSDELIRLDFAIAINALALFHEFGRGEQLRETEEWVFNMLKTRAHKYSSHYYTTPDLILFFVSRMLQKAQSLRPRFLGLLRECILERKEAVVDSMSLAARLIAAARCGIRDDSAVNLLVMSQQTDGSWPPGAIYKSPQSGQLCYHHGLTTAWAIQAIRDQTALALNEVC
ncbi:hypothetical protein NUU61_008239 [Penicillium alfredii]|uniref:Uncharacterized protein n=1 Tax=Penicillium alfredii TaxID=1506179 RepID=A0A9W9ES03_9EURO|nr:uncharacterized protein NUU61_008239 [Penicillium alfredii]KAJ5086932.1 hypothetical protein NUU61_008239 [Penicillium alfredii]